MLRYTLGTGETVDVPFSDKSTVTIENDVTVDGGPSVERTVHTDIVAFEIIDDPVEEQPVIEQLPGDGVVPGAEQNEPGTSLDLEANAGDTTAPGGDGTDEAGSVEDHAGDVDVPGVGTVEPDAVTPADVGTHDEAVDAATVALANANAAESADAAKEQLDQAIADVDAAIAVYPDSAELADAKAQLAELHAHAASYGGQA